MEISSHREHASRDCESVAPGQFQSKLIWFGSRRVPVLSIVDRWYGPHHSWWKIDTEDGFYVLRRDDSSHDRCCKRTCPVLRFLRNRWQQH